MFRTLARLFGDPLLADPLAVPLPERVFTTHPEQLDRWLEEVWAHGAGARPWPGLGAPVALLGLRPIVDQLRLPAGLSDGGLKSGINNNRAPGFEATGPTLGTTAGTVLPWEHLIYPYLVESTGVVEILTEVLRRYVTGETLEVTNLETHSWLRATEELFFRNPPGGHIRGVLSEVRPLHRVNRRAAYWRLFGMDLPHPAPGVTGTPWKADTGQQVNTRFREVWVELLRQVAIGIDNDRNEVGANPTNRGQIAYLCESLAEMMAMRRRFGTLAREEFAYVSMLSWFHLTVESDTAVVRDLQASVGAGGDPGDRLGRIAARVGMTPPRATRELFELADLVSALMRFIEIGRFNDPAQAELLFRADGVPAPAISTTMNRIIDLWQSGTGERIRDMTVRVAPAVRAAPPARLPAAPFRPASSGTAGAPVSTARPAAVTNGAAQPVRT